MNSVNLWLAKSCRPVIWTVKDRLESISWTGSPRVIRSRILA